MDLIRRVINFDWKIHLLIWGIIFISLLAYFIPRFFIDQQISICFLYLLLSGIFLLICFFVMKHISLLRRYILSFIIIFLLCMSIAYSLNSIDYALTPNLLNLNQNDAKNLVEKEGLIAEVTYIPVNDSSLNKKVLSQEPIPGVFVQKNSKIKMVVGSIGIVAITSPKVNGSEVGNITTISGLVQNLKNGEKVYVLVQPQPVSGDGPYVWYIQPTPSQPTPLTIKPDGTWKCNVYLGKTGDINRQFKIVAIITDKNLTSSDNQFELPDNQAVSDPIYVTRVQ